MKLTLKDYFAKVPRLDYRERSIAGNLCSLFSPRLVVFSVNNGISPNTLTLYMIILGVIGNIVLLIPSPLFKILSFILLYFWFVFDCADGQTARFENNFSNYGKELDWMSHLTCHPLFIFAIWFTYYYLNFQYLIILTISSFFLLAVELIGRNIIAIDSFLFDGKMHNGEENKTLPSFFFYVLTQFFYFPNVVIIAPLLLAVDQFLHLDLFIWLYMFWSVVYTLYGIKEIIKYIWFFYKH